MGRLLSPRSSIGVSKEVKISDARIKQVCQSRGARHSLFCCHDHVPHIRSLHANSTFSFFWFLLNCRSVPWILTPLRIDRYNSRKWACDPSRRVFSLVDSPAGSLASNFVRFPSYSIDRPYRSPPIPAASSAVHLTSAIVIVGGLISSGTHADNECRDSATSINGGKWRDDCSVFSFLQSDLQVYKHLLINYNNYT